MDIIIFSLITFTIGVIVGKILFASNTDTSFFIKRIQELELETKNLQYENMHKSSTLAVSEEKNRSMEQQMADWEKTKIEFMQSSKIASLEASKDLTNQILQQHEQQSKRTAEDTEKRIEKSTKELHESYKELFSSVGHMRKSLDTNSDTVETIKMAISSSANVGYASETVLENALTTLGLTKDIDFFTQISFDSDEGKLRPDAVVLLPDDNALVIDSKSSKFIWELAEAEKSGIQDSIDIAYNNLKSSMNTHLKSLASKDYAGAIKNTMKKMGKSTNLNKITVIMWLPNDGAVDKVLHADPTFTKRASASNIFVCGITGLWMAIGMASQQISSSNQSKNSQKIMDEAESLLNNIATVVGYGDKVSKGLNSANKAWDSFIKSFDGRFLVGAKRIEKLGAKVNKPLLPLGKNATEDALEIDTETLETLQIKE